jgi:hypothetical protein
VSPKVDFPAPSTHHSGKGPRTKKAKRRRAERARAEAEGIEYVPARKPRRTNAGANQ